MVRIVRPGRRLLSSDHDVIKIVHVVKRTDAHASSAEGSIDHRQMRFGHVIKVDVDLPALHIAFDTNGVPIIRPRNSLFILGHGSTRGIVDNHDLTTCRVRSCSQVNVVKLFGVLVSKEHAAISVISSIFGAAHPKRHFKASEFKIFDQSDVPRTPDGWFIGAFPLGDSQRVIARVVEDLPRVRVHNFPAINSFFKIFRECRFGRFKRRCPCRWDPRDEDAQDGHGEV